MSVPTAEPPAIRPRITGASERDRVVTPYDPGVWRACLAELGLDRKHEGLADAMESGFHIRDLSPIRETVVHSNYPAAEENISFIEDYIREQVQLGRMTGPYSRARVEEILGSSFISSPLSVVPKANGKLRLIQDCSKEDGDGLSVNGRIDADLFPTEWGTASEVAQLVSVFLTTPQGRCDCRSRDAIPVCRDAGARRAVARGAQEPSRARVRRT